MTLNDSSGFKKRQKREENRKFGSKLREETGLSSPVTSATDAGVIQPAEAVTASGGTAVSAAAAAARDRRKKTRPHPVLVK